ncbi:hypothetical protein [Pandoraea sp. NPDC087047]|uniref:hypothetical protein n=1 Tax=Pandoraea sp. NPDC087047 TaxID=3364390 RepID=UPI00380D6D21
MSKPIAKPSRGGGSTGKKQQRANVSWAQAVRDMVTASINRGQLPLFGFFFIIVVLVLKMPAEDVSRLVFELLACLKQGELIAYIVSGLLALGWFWHAKVMRKISSDEFDRIGNEKSRLQSQVTGVPYKSSDKP